MSVSFVENWGSTAAERAHRYPCDEWVTDADAVLYRAIDVRAPASVTFRWLCQLRAAPYSYDWIDNFGRRSPRELIAGLDQLAVGQRFMRIFRLASFLPDRHITLLLDNPAALVVFGPLAGTYQVTPVAGGSRLVVKLRSKRPGGAFRWLSPLLPAGDWIMMRKQLLELRRHAERSARSFRGAW